MGRDLNPPADFPFIGAGRRKSLSNVDRLSPFGVLDFFNIFDEAPFTPPPGVDFFSGGLTPRGLGRLRVGAPLPPGPLLRLLLVLLVLVLVLPPLVTLLGLGLGLGFRLGLALGFSETAAGAAGAAATAARDSPGVKVRV